MKKFLSGVFGILAILVSAISTLIGTLIVGIVVFWNIDLAWWLRFPLFFVFNIIWYWGGYFLGAVLMSISDSLSD